MGSNSPSLHIKILGNHHVIRGPGGTDEPVGHGRRKAPILHQDGRNPVRNMVNAPRIETTVASCGEEHISLDNKELE